MKVVCNCCGDSRELSKNVNPLPCCPLCGSADRVRRDESPEPVESDRPVPVEVDEEASEEVAVVVEDDDGDDGP